MRAMPVFLMTILAVRASAGTILVDAGGAGDFLTIQDGINAASFGDTVAVMPGTYSGLQYVDMHDPMSMNGASIVMRDGVVLMSIEGPDSTTIEGVGLQAAVFFDNCGPESVLSGFTIRSEGDGYGLRTSVLCYESSPLIEGNVFSPWICSIYCKQQSSPTIADNVAADGAFAFASGSGGTVIGNTIEGRISVFTTGEPTLPLTIESNIVGTEAVRRGSERQYRGIGISWGGPGEVVVRDNLIRGKDVGVKLCRGTLTNNRFSDNTVNVEVDYPCYPWEDVNAELNWWGTANAEEIDAKIIDCHDDPSLESCVDYSPWCLDEDCAQTAAPGLSWSAVKALYSNK